MLKTQSMLALSAVALLAACGQNNDAVPQQPDANPAATIPTPADETAAPDFVNKMAASDMYEIEAAHVALDRSQNADVKAFAQMMIDDHTKSTSDLKSAVTASDLALTMPTALPQDLMDKVDALKNADADSFDKTYIDQQVSAHQDALNLLQRYANDGDNDALKNFALATAPVVQGHFDKAQALQKSVDGA